MKGQELRGVRRRRERTGVSHRTAGREPPPPPPQVLTRASLWRLPHPARPRPAPCGAGASGARRGRRRCPAAVRGARIPGPVPPRPDAPRRSCHEGAARGAPGSPEAAQPAARASSGRSAWQASRSFWPAFARRRFCSVQTRPPPTHAARSLPAGGLQEPSAAEGAASARAACERVPGSDHPPALVWGQSCVAALSGDFVVTLVKRTQTRFPPWCRVCERCCLGHAVSSLGSCQLRFCAEGEALRESGSRGSGQRTVHFRCCRVILIDHPSFFKLRHH